MDDEKSALEKVTDSVKGAMETIVEGARSMVSPESGTPINMPHNERGAETARAARTKKRPAKKAPSSDPERAAVTTNEQIYIPEATYAAATPAPLFPARKQNRSASPASKRMATAKRGPPKTSKTDAKQAAKKTTKRAKKLLRGSHPLRRLLKLQRRKLQSEDADAPARFALPSVILAEVVRAG